MTVTTDFGRADPYVARVFPPGSVHLGVVDPGVGSTRPMVAIERPEFFRVDIELS